MDCTVYFYETVDKNYTNHPIAYCKYYKKALTNRLIKVHKCKKKCCWAYKADYKFE